MFSEPFLNREYMGLVKDILYKLSNEGLMKLFKNQSIFPYYHIVRDEEVHHIKNLYNYKNSCEFIKDLDILLENYTPIDPKDIICKPLSAFKIPKNSFLLSFDDGLKEAYDIIFPILKKKKVKAIFFVNPLYIDNNTIFYKHYLSVIVEDLKEMEVEKAIEVSRVLGIDYVSRKQISKSILAINFSNKKLMENIGAIVGVNLSSYLKENQLYLTKDNIQEMIEEGFCFGGHTMSHSPLNELTSEEKEKEVIGSIDWLKSNFKLKYTLFAFPFSDRGIKKSLINKIFEYDQNSLIFGNSGLKQDIDKRIIQRFSLEDPSKSIKRRIVTENLYKFYNKAIFKYRIKRSF